MGFINYLPQLKEYEMDMDKMLERLVNGKVETIFEALGWSLASSECEEINDLFA
jgi:shikimate kinase